MDPSIVFPVPGATLRGSVQVFDWDLGGIPIEGSWLYAGTVPGGTQHGAKFVGADTLASLGDLPTDGSPVFVRIWYQTRDQWLRLDATYTAAGEPAQPFVTDPAQSGDQLDGESHTFEWDFNGLIVESSWLYVGSEAGASDYAAQLTGSTTEATINRLPTDEDPNLATTIHVRLYFKVGGSWYFTDDQFKAGQIPVPDRDTLTRELQGLVGTTADGIVGPQTKSALNRNWLGRPESFDPSFAQRFTNDAALVTWVQRRMNTRGRLGLELDGQFDRVTESAVVDHLDRGGVVAAESFLALLEPGG
jgi:peptidoglycan hydrolase-like protein with peptidoglycan-binding domain